MFDLNALISSGSTLHLEYTETINDRGEIAGTGVDATGTEHAFLAIPCDENHADVEGCDYRMVDATVVARSEESQKLQSAASANVRSLLQQRRRIGRFGAVPYRPQ